MVQEVHGHEEFRRLTGQKGKLVVVDFTATWCGPCKMVAPMYEQLASQHPDVLFLKVVEGSNKELLVELSIKAFPTFRFYLDGNQVDETRGANIQEVAKKVELHKKNAKPSFGGEGVSLGGTVEGASAAPPNAAEARAKRLARFSSEVSTGTGKGPDPEIARRNAKILAHAGAGDIPDVPTPISATAAGASASAMDVDPPAAPAGGGSGGRPRRPADPALVSQLLDMGFQEVRAKKGLMFGSGSDLESAVNWLMEHQEDPDIDDPIPFPEGSSSGEGAAASGAGTAEGASTAPQSMQVDGGSSGGDAGAAAQSLKCDQCGTILKDVTAAELHAHKTGHSEFSESTEAAKTLTPEEKAAKIAKMKELIAARRIARGQEEKVDHIKREKARRTMGKEAAKTKEEMQAMARKHELARIKKEKEDFERERARLKEEIARDKAERKARGGKLSTKLGVDGYNPSAPQGTYGGASGAQSQGRGEATQGAVQGDGAAKARAEPASTGREEASEEKMLKAVDRLARQTVAGLGGTAMKTCLAYIKNALEKPQQEEKFRSINLDNNAYRNRVAPCIGGTALLKAVGFAKEEGRLYMSLEARDEDLLRTAKTTLEKALASYVPSKTS
ncbi:unnamed protein product [Ascophyllum nodosum]